MKLKKEILFGIVAGLVVGIPQGLGDFPNFVQGFTAEKLGGMATFGFIGGLLLGMCLLSRANPEPKEHGAFASFMIGALSIGIPTIARYLNGNLLQSINVQAAFFTLIALAMILGGLLSGIASKKLNKAVNERQQAARYLSVREKKLCI